MIRYFFMLTRLRSVAPQRFHDHWRHPHASYGNLIPGIRSYVQAHHVHTDLLDAGQDQHEAISVLEFESAAEAAGLLTEAQYYDWILPDEPRFMDKSAIEAFATEEEVIVARPRKQDGASYGDSLWHHLDRSTSIQLLQFVRPDGNPGWAGTDDAELGRRIGAVRHARNHPARAFYGDAPPFLGARQLWWPTRTTFEDGVAADPGAFDELVGRGGHSFTLLVQSERFVR